MKHNINVKIVIKSVHKTSFILLLLHNKWHPYTLQGKRIWEINILKKSNVLFFTLNANYNIKKIIFLHIMMKKIKRKMASISWAFIIHKALWWLLHTSSHSTFFNSNTRWALVNARHSGRNWGPESLGNLSSWTVGELVCKPGLSWLWSPHT